MLSVTTSYNPSGCAFFAPSISCQVSFQHSNQVGSRSSSLCQKLHAFYVAVLQAVTLKRFSLPKVSSVSTNKLVYFKSSAKTPKRHTWQSWQSRSCDRKKLNLSEINIKKIESTRRTCGFFRHDSRTILKVETRKCPKKCCYPQMKQVFEI